MTESWKDIERKKRIRLKFNVGDIVFTDNGCLAEITGIGDHGHYGIKSLSSDSLPYKTEAIVTMDRSRLATLEELTTLRLQGKI